ncbi:Probable E3 ubiquitin-protein ligase RHY1A [Linum perenne]
MTSASELFYQRRSRVGRPSTELPLALDPSGSDRGLHLNYGRRHHHIHGHSNTNGRHDLDGCDPLRRSLHVRHNCHRVSERSSARFDQGSSQHVPNNSSGPETSNSSGRPRVTANERLPGPVLLARARLLERLRGVSLSGSRRNSRPSFSIHNREYTFGDDLRAVDAGDWGINLLEPWSPVGSPYRDSRSERERIQSLKNKPPGLTLEELGRLKVEVYLNAAECGGEGGSSRVSKVSWDCSICLESFIEGEELIRLPCEHRFHSGCLDPWVRACGDCPYCRRDIVVSSSYQV